MPSSGSLIETFAVGKLKDIRVRRHMVAVYGLLSLCFLFAAIGAYASTLSEYPVGTSTVVISIILFTAVYVTPHRDETINRRTVFLLSFAFVNGFNVGPLIEFSLQLDDDILPASMFVTGIVFCNFSLCAVFCHDQRWLYALSTLFSCVTNVLFLEAANAFHGSKILPDIYVWSGIVFACGCVIFDTQSIIAKAAENDEDYILHCLHLYVDVIDVLRRLVTFFVARLNSNPP